MRTCLLAKRWRVVLAGILSAALPIILLALYVYAYIAAHLENLIMDGNLHNAQ